MEMCPGRCHASAYYLQMARGGSIAHQNPDQDVSVTAHSLRSLTSPATLAAFDGGLLHDLLVGHRTYLAAHGYVLPAQRTSPLNLAAIATALMADDPAFPAALADGLALIVETGTDRHLAAIEAALRRLPAVGSGGDGAAGSPVDLATRLWLARPDLLRRIHAEASVPAVKRYESWRCATGEVPRFVLPAEPEALLTSWAGDLDAHLVAHRFGGGTQIFVSTAGRLVYLLIRHGAILQRVETHQDDGSTSSLVYRPAVTDVLRYDPATGELGIHLQKHTKWLSEAIRATFSLRIFGIPHLFSGERRYTLAPIHTLGEAAIDCSGDPAIESVTLTEVEIAYGDQEDGTILYRAADVFAFLRERGIVLGDQPQPTAVKLRFVMTDGSVRTAAIRAPNVAVYQRLGDDDVIGAFLRERGFTQAEQDDERDQVA
jgi:hypothetical protein